MKHDVTVLLSLLAVLCSAAALAGWGLEHRELRELRARRPAMGWEGEPPKFTPSVNFTLAPVTSTVDCTLAPMFMERSDCCNEGVLPLEHK